MSSKGKDMQPYWRPDFRDPSTLPDIKVVRTDFLVNVVSVVLLAVIAVFVLQREYRAWALKGRIASLDDDIRLAEPDDRTFIKQSQDFRESGQYIVEMNSFYEAPFSAHELLVELAMLKQEELMFTQVTLSESIATPKRGAKPVAGPKPIEYQIRIDGEVHEENLDVFDIFKQALRESDYLKVDGYETRIAEDMGSKDERNDLFPYVLTIQVAPVQKAAKPEGAKG